VQFELADDTVSIFVTPLRASKAQLQTLERWLHPTEVERGNRFVTEELQHRFKIGRGLLRWLLGSFLQAEPSELEFSYGQWGKPELKLPPLGPQVHFNVSHSLDWAMFAISSSPLGVDLEVWQDRIKYRSIASQILSKTEELEFNQLPASQHAETILKLWVCKESVLKAMGLGIAEGLRKTTYKLPIPDGTFSPEKIDSTLQLHLDDDGSCRMNHWTDANAWVTRLINLEPLLEGPLRGDDCPKLYSALTTMPGTSDIQIQPIDLAQLPH